MKTLTLPRSALVLSAMAVLAALCLSSCKRETKTPPEKPKKKEYTFSGKIASTSGEVVKNPRIWINGKVVKADDKGTFKEEADSAGRFVLTIKARGYGLLSKVFYGSVNDYTYKLKPAFLATIDPTKPNKIKDLLSMSNCGGNPIQNIQFDSAYKKIPFVYDSQGKLVDFGWPAGMKSLYDYAVGSPACNPGATISIPANSIMNSAKKSVTTQTTLSISTIDLNSPDGMPGDYSFQDQSGGGMMVSLGAVAIEVYSENEDYNIDPSKPATLSLPVEPTSIRFKHKIADAIPVLYYDDKLGVWRQENEQMAKLNRKTMSYDVDLHHFSAINMDYKNIMPSCLKFRQDPISPQALVSPFRLTMFSATAGYRTSTAITQGVEDIVTGCKMDPTTSSNLHFVYNIPKAEEICLILTNSPAGNVPPTAFYGIQVFTSSSQQYVHSGAAPPCTCNMTPTCPDVTNCDETTCRYFVNADCGYLKAKAYDNAVIGLAKLNSGVLYDVKFIFKTSPSGTYTATIHQFDAMGNETTNAMPVATYNAADPIQKIQVTKHTDITDASKNAVYFTITTTATGSSVSNRVDFP